jgi:hypothetical protein
LKPIKAGLMRGKLLKQGAQRTVYAMFLELLIPPAFNLGQHYSGRKEEFENVFK